MELKLTSEAVKTIKVEDIKSYVHSEIERCEEDMKSILALMKSDDLKKDIINTDSISSMMDRFKSLNQLDAEFQYLNGKISVLKRLIKQFNIT